MPSRFRRSHAIIIGIDKYSNGIQPLVTAVNDAKRLNEILVRHGYNVRLLVNEEATLSHLQTLFRDELPQQISQDDRLLLYFAGHGVARSDDKGPEGYLIPQDANQNDKNTFWKMTALHSYLEQLPCRHMLAILDCCFAGAFRWSSKRDFQPLPPVIYQERFDRFLRDPAWQVITSAAYNQKALDNTLSGYPLGEHGVIKNQQQPHSPFALSLFEALDGAADLIPEGGDGIITAMELASYLQYHVSDKAEQIDHQQMPQLWPLNKHGHGEFIFLLRPEDKIKLSPAPQLTKDNNPYKGLASYEKGDSKLFFGRTDLIIKLQDRVKEQPFTVVAGASGTGKSSLVKAGLLPLLENPPNTSETEDTSDRASSWFIPENVLRPGTNPTTALRSLLITELPGVRPERTEGASATGLIG
ncbi:MAG: hypothetical protein D3908_03535, partial [Candidatus Electrothrix sp. AUS4]|nr:hypothetical protein [Candidatus Electrothrix sp. AUS4]